MSRLAAELPWTLNRATKSRSIPIKPPHSNGYWRTKAISSIHLIAYVGADARGIVAPESPSPLLIVRTASKTSARTYATGSEAIRSCRQVDRCQCSMMEAFATLLFRNHFLLIRQHSAMDWVAEADWRQ